MQDLLSQLGLNSAQAIAFLALLHRGALTPAALANEINETRTNTYNLLDQLTKLELIEKTHDPKTTYAAKNPTTLRQMLLKKTRALNKTAAELNGALPSLLSTYRLAYHKPGVVQMDGDEAFEMIYGDIIRNKAEPLIFPSQHDRDDTATAKIIDAQIARQQQAGLASKVAVAEDSPVRGEEDKLARQQVYIRPVLKQQLPAQIIIYGDNVAFTTFTAGVNSTVISNPEIAETLRRIFMQLWQAESSDDIAPGTLGDETPRDSSRHQ